METATAKTCVFISNYFNHHQRPLSEELNKIFNDGYHFIETSVIPAERIALGYGESSYPDYVITKDALDKNMEKYRDIIDSADVAIFGSAPYSFIDKRLKRGKLTFIYSERLDKNPYPWYKLPVRILRIYKKYTRYPSAHLLCASAFTSADYKKAYAFRNKAYKFGYFPKVKDYENIESVISEKNSASILWTARLIDFKHPEYVVEVAKRLKHDGYDFNIDIIGIGDMKENIEASIAEQGLEENVHLHGAMSPDSVRKHMERSEIFLFTSDRNEGWGAVLNESMNSACAVVASHAIGSVPFMIDDGVNGLIYQSGNIDDLYNKVKRLLDNRSLREQISRNAYLTMHEEWNEKKAAQRLKILSEYIIEGKKENFPFENGVCSKADVLNDDWYKV